MDHAGPFQCETGISYNSDFAYHWNHGLSGHGKGDLPGKNLLHLFFISPILVPIIVIAFAAYGTFAKFHLIGTTTGMVLAHTIVCVPFVILVISANLYRFEVSLEMAARNLGANSPQDLYMSPCLDKVGRPRCGCLLFHTIP